ncbi:transcriptional regulator, LysR family [Tistlia consotensis]|uniref:Transcriptional regulator, LysR family n=1 Tax=Tistlia consotensis USBA 355 TaxID=560819 RepID=A0A1Y6BB19_9PROT|nr:LysR family transcriptional regulator [Tistlia consotensis]SMF02236.1 transcriptional regulator, LysR family [Tistlia consotensis USBA 355]SNS26532.1 transcriptional regulator, LysR family [Tistlia consotensis]
MQPLDWNDLRHLLAAARAGTLAGAAADLGVDATTVSRRLAALERALGARLLERAGDGRLRPSEAGRRALVHAEEIERAAGRLGGSVAGADRESAGTVRLTAVPLIAERLLVPALPDLFAAHPGLRLELVAEPADLSLTRRQADMALRLARPRGSSRSVVARRIGRLAYGVYAPAAMPAADAEALPWLTFDEAWAHLPPARWIAAALAREGRPAALAANDGATLLEAAAAGLGRTLLPDAVAGRDPRLRRLSGPAGPAGLPVRELWLLVHAELRGLARIAAVAGWLAALLPQDA